MEYIQIVRNLIIQQYKDNFPKAKSADIEKYVDNLFAFQDYLAEKHNITRQEGVAMCLDLIKKDSDDILAKNEKKLAVLSMIENNMKKGINPTKESIQAIQPESVSESIQRIALSQGYPEDKASLLGNSAKFLD
jgi:hypothetical protein